MPCSGYEPSPNSTAVSVANHSTGWVAINCVNRECNIGSIVQYWIHVLLFIQEEERTALTTQMTASKARRLVNSCTREILAAYQR
ncbi:hypothetical protein TNCV_143931 [Trichonephila clavipes]|nr:hypothetical protein TNCV_143931 [Trichonephila clavipes]